MNAHINLDLGIAAAEVCPGEQLPALRRDFDTINDILLGLLGTVQAAINRVSPMFHVLDALCGDVDEHLASFSMVQARKQSWRSACLLAQLPAAGRPVMISQLDNHTAALARLLIRPDPLTAGALGVVRMWEPDDVAEMVRTLQKAV